MEKAYVISLIFLLFSLSFPVQSKSIEKKNVNQSIQLARQFLINKVLQDKYYLICKSSGKSVCPLINTGKVFSSYFIIESLRNNVPQSLRNKIEKLILSEKKGTLWGYSIYAPVDSDDSSFALQALALLGNHQNTDSIYAFYKEFIDGYSTFLTNVDSSPAILTSKQGNDGIHPEVNANIYTMFALLKVDKKINYDLIANFQSEEGYWYSYFYPSQYYSTYLTMNLLCSTNHLSDQVKKGANFIIKSQHSDGSWGEKGNAYETALALNALLACHYRNNAVTKGVEYLLSKQNKDGYWAADNMIWSYIYQEHPLVKWAAYDSEHVVTTALALTALNRYYEFT